MVRPGFAYGSLDDLIVSVTEALMSLMKRDTRRVLFFIPFGCIVKGEIRICFLEGKK